MTRHGECGYCGAKNLMSKKGNIYCSAICWETEEYKKDKLADEALMDAMHSDWGCRDE